MRSPIRSFSLAILILLCALALPAAAQVTTYNGSFPDGATYLIQVPANWNGTLLLYSHGYVVPGSSNPAHDVGDPLTGATLLAQGFALAGSSYAHTGWAIQEALFDQIAVLDTFTALVGPPTRTIAWGHSLGGIITAGLVQRNPSRFDGALPMCGVLAGGVGTWNQALDGTFAFKTLLAPNAPLQVVNITNPFGNLNLAEQVLFVAQQTPQGRARIALAAALADLPGWFSAGSPEPAATDFDAQEANQFLWFQQVDLPFTAAFRAELEFRAGGNPSTNVGVNYQKQLENSVDYAEVQALYAEAGLDLNADIATLNNAERIAANQPSVDYLTQNISFNGDINIPVLTMHTTGDGLVVVEDESAYAKVVRKAGNNPLLRRTFIHRAGHCSFTPAETLTALQTLIQRMDSGKWPSVDAGTMNTDASSLGPTLNLGTSPGFIDFEPAPFLRPAPLP